MSIFRYRETPGAAFKTIASIKGDKGDAGSGSRAEIIDKLGFEPANKLHEHSQYATKDELSEKADSIHYHSQYLTEHQDLSGKADVVHTHNTLDTKIANSAADFIGNGFYNIGTALELYSGFTIPRNAKALFMATSSNPNSAASIWAFDTNNNEYLAYRTTTGWKDGIITKHDYYTEMPIYRHDYTVPSDELLKAGWRWGASDDLIIDAADLPEGVYELSYCINVDSLGDGAITAKLCDGGEQNEIPFSRTTASMSSGFLISVNGSCEFYSDGTSGVAIAPMLYGAGNYRITGAHIYCKRVGKDKINK